MADVLGNTIGPCTVDLDNDDELTFLRRKTARQEKAIQILRTTLHKEVIFLRTQLLDKSANRSMNDTEAAYASFFDIFEFLDGLEDSKQVARRMQDQFDIELAKVNNEHAKNMLEMESVFTAKLSIALERVDFF
eukprot:PhF_6_TR17080/c0_g1_i1/m.26210